MKNTFTLLVAALASLGLSAQITIDSNDMGAIGDTVEMVFDNDVTGKQMDAPTGAAQNFDYKGIGITGTGMIHFLNPANTPNASDFPNSNLAIDLYGESMAYGNKTNSKVEVTGYYGDLLGLGVVVPVRIDPGLTIVNFPTDYQDTYSEIVYMDTTIEDTFTGFFDSLRLIRTINTVSNVDAYGTLELPNLTEDVLRRSDVEVTVDSVFGQVFGIWQPVLQQVDTTRALRFFAKNRDYYVLEAEINGAGQVLTAEYQLGASLYSGIVSFDDISCYGETDAMATASGFGGLPPYSYLWNDAANTTTADISGLGAGNYQVTVTDNMGSTHVSSITVVEPDSLKVTSSAIGPDYGGNSGYIDLDVQGGTPGYNYSWSNGQTSKNVVDLMHGDYTVTVTDSRGCTKVATFTVDDITSVEDIRNNPNVNLFPNPSNGQINLATSGKWELLIINNVGQIIVSKQGVGNQIIDISNQPSGLYFAKVKVDGQWYITKVQLAK